MRGQKLILLVFCLVSLALGQKVFASSTPTDLLLDTVTGHTLVNIVYPHYGFTPTASGTLDNMDIIFSTSNPAVDFVVTLEYPFGAPIDCRSSTVSGASGNDLDHNSITTHVVGFHGADCQFIAGRTYGINFGSLPNGVWGDGTGGFGIRYINRGFLNPFSILRSDGRNKKNGTQYFSQKRSRNAPVNSDNVFNVAEMTFQ